MFFFFFNSILKKENIKKNQRRTFGFLIGGRAEIFKRIEKTHNVVLNNKTVQSIKLTVRTSPAFNFI